MSETENGSVEAPSVNNENLEKVVDSADQLDRGSLVELVKSMGAKLMGKKPVDKSSDKTPAPDSAPAVTAAPDFEDAPAGDGAGEDAGNAPADAPVDGGEVAEAPADEDNGADAPVALPDADEETELKKSAAALAASVAAGASGEGPMVIDSTELIIGLAEQVIMGNELMQALPTELAKAVAAGVATMLGEPLQKCIASSTVQSLAW